MNKLARQSLFLVVALCVAAIYPCSAEEKREASKPGPAAAAHHERSQDGASAPAQLDSPLSPDQIKRKELIKKHGEQVAEAILAWKVLKDMTAEQVLLARGEPVSKETIPPNAELWHYAGGEVAFSAGKVTYVGLRERGATSAAAGGIAVLADPSCAHSYLEVIRGGGQCGIGLTTDGRLTVDGKKDSDQTEEASKLRLWPASPNGRYRIVVMELEIGCLYFIVSLESGDVRAAGERNYGPETDWVSWSPDSAYAVYPYYDDGYNMLIVIRASDGKKWTVLNEGYVRFEHLEWLNDSTFQAPSFSCKSFDFDHDRCWAAAKRAQYPLKQVRLGPNGPK